MINIALLYIQDLSSQRTSALTGEKFVLGDERGSLVSELVSGIKIVKFSGWEEIILSRIYAIRNKERDLIKTINNIMYFTNSLQYVTSKLSSLAILMIFYFRQEEIKVVEFFAIMSILSGIEALISTLMLALNLSRIVEVSSQRFSEIARLKEKKQVIDDNMLPRGQIQLENASVTWEDRHTQQIFEEDPPTSSPAPTLKAINLKIQPGEFIGVVGEIGAGKTALLLTLLGELNFLEGEMRKNGTIAYISQEAFLINDTLRNNITFGNDFNEKHYNSVLDLCELEHDISLLPARDLSEIGERGLNLSGGQRQRISIARAVYSQNDIFVIDDALSALDGDVGGRLMRRLFLEKLQYKTRIMSTHKLSLLSHFDRIIFMSDCGIANVGTLDELKKDSKFMEFIRHIQEEHQSENNYQGNSTSSRSQNIEDDGKLVENEEQLEGLIESKTFFTYILSSGTSFTIVTILFFILCEIFRMWIDYWLGHNLGEFFREDNYHRTKWILVFFIAILTFLLLIRSLLYGTVVSRSAYNLSTSMMNNIFRRPMSYFDTTSTGVIMNRCTKDVNTLDTILPRTLSLVIMSTITLIVTFTLASLVTISSSVFFIIFILTTIGYFKRYIRVSLQMSRMMKVSASPVMSKLGEFITGSVVFRQYKKTEFFLAKFIEASNLLSTVKFHELISEVWIKIRLEYSVFLMIASTNIAITVAKSLRLMGSDTVVSVGLTLNYLFILGDITGSYLYVLTETIKNMSAAERIQQEIESKQHEDAFIKGMVDSKWPKTGSIVIKNLHIRYRQGLPLVINNLQLNIKNNEKVGIIGRTGSGKSTLFLALLRIIEADDISSLITIDGVDIRELGLHELRKKIVIIPQEPLIIKGTLKANLDPFSEFCDEELMRCIFHLGFLTSFQLKNNRLNISEQLESIIDINGGSLLLLEDNLEDEQHSGSMKDLLEMKIESKGSNLSQGQRQLISIARAFLKKPKILLMDEATASIDEKTDSFLQKIFRDDFKNSTILTIAHRTETLKEYDSIVVMHDGTIIDKGTPSQIFQRLGNDIQDCL